MKITSALNLKTILIFFGCCGLLWVLTSPARFAPFNIKDDHFYLKIARPGMGYFNTYEDKEKFDSFGNYFKKFKTNEGRYFPVLRSYMWITGKLSGAEPFRVQLWLFLNSCAAVLLFILILRAARFSDLAILLGTLLLITGRFPIIWYFCTGELPGLVVLLAGILLLIHAGNNIRLQGASLFFLLLASGSKESFAALMPALMYGALLLNSYKNNCGMKEALRNTWVFQSGCVLILGFSSFMIFRTMMYDTHELPPFSVPVFLRNLALLPGNSFTLIPVAAYAAVLLLRKKAEVFHLRLLLLWFLWIAPQAIVYAQKDFTYFSRYYIPGQLAGFFLAAYCIHKLYRMLDKKIFVMLVAALFFCIALAGKNVYTKASQYAAKNKAYHRMIQYLADRINPASDKILVMEDYGWMGSFLENTAVYLSAMNIDIPITSMRDVVLMPDGQYRLQEPAKLIADYTLSTDELTKDQARSLFCQDTTLKWILYSRHESDGSTTNFMGCEGFEKKLFREESMEEGIRDILLSFAGRDPDRPAIRFTLEERR